MHGVDDFLKYSVSRSGRTNVKLVNIIVEKGSELRNVGVTPFQNARGPSFINVDLMQWMGPLNAFLFITCNRERITSKGTPTHTQAKAGDADTKSWRRNSGKSEDVDFRVKNVSLEWASLSPPGVLNRCLDNICVYTAMRLNNFSRSIAMEKHLATHWKNCLCTLTL